MDTASLLLTPLNIRHYMPELFNREIGQTEKWDRHHLKIDVDSSSTASFCFYTSEIMMTISFNRIGMTASLHQIKQLN
jgi:hypothetical protein